MTAPFPLVRLPAKTTPSRRVFCMPHAGGGILPYRTWHQSLPHDVEVLAFQLPGRESRLLDAPLRSIDAMVDAVLPAIERWGDVPFALFGHSMGALLAFEITRALEQRQAPAPTDLFVSARRAPDQPDPHAPLRHLHDDAFLDTLQARFAAVPAEVRQEPELLELLVPALRADVEAVETYVMRPGAPVRARVHVYGGADDRFPTPAELAQWQQVAAQPIRIRIFAGDHFFLNTQRDALTADIARHWSVPLR